MGKNNLNFDFNFLIATWFGLGKSKIMPGTVGSFAAVLMWIFLNNFILNFSDSKIFFYSSWIGFIVFLFFLGAKSSTIYSKKIAKNDPGEIVVDEVVGQLIALVISSYFISANLIYMLILSFLFFRLFDITKPLFIRSSEKWMKDGYGIMIDDVFAGLFAAFFVVIVFKIWDFS